MEFNERTFQLVPAFSLQVLDGSIGFWSRNPNSARHFITLDPVQASILLQFAGTRKSPRQAAVSAGVEYEPNVDGLVLEFVNYRVLCEHPTVNEVPYYRLYHPGIEEAESICVVDAKAFDEATVGSTLEGLRSSGLVGGNVLSEGFAGTCGFGVKFRIEALEVVINWFPWTRLFLEKVIGSYHDQSWPSLSADNLLGMNALYLNALVIPAGKGTGLHIDCTLDGRTPAARVSVLYLQTVDPPGGRLVLQKGAFPVAVINPQAGMLVHFRGDLNHGVSDTQRAERERTSLVCEQYCLPAETLSGCPFLEIIATHPKATISA